MSKKKKPKVTYYDDNSTISDMSLVPRAGERTPPDKNAPPKKKSTAKEKFATYWAAVKMMVIPMCVALIILAAIFLFLYFLGTLA